MNDNEYMSISAFAEVVGVSTQNIYERIRKKDNAIQRYIVPNSKPVKIHISAIKELYNKTLQSPLSSDLQSEKIESMRTHNKVPLQPPNESQRLQDESNAYLKVIEILENQIEQQKKDLESKDKIIASITDRLQESQKLLDQQQQLALADKKNMAELENKIKLLEQPQHNEDAEFQKKWSIFSLFKGRGRNESI